jgi:RNA polymerase sigma factor (TIGR02999 family)
MSAHADAEPDVTQLLLRLEQGDRQAVDLLLPAVYRELRRLAAGYLQRERGGHTLQPTALVHEAYLRMVDQSRVQWQNRGHFFGIAAQMMRRVLVDHARSQGANKRGGGAEKLPLGEELVASIERSSELVAIDDALAALEQMDPDKAKVVELRFFGGLSIEETAAATGVSVATVNRQWRMAKAWLYAELQKKEIGA